MCTVLLAVCPLLNTQVSTYGPDAWNPDVDFIHQIANKPPVILPQTTHSHTHQTPMSAKASGADAGGPNGDAKHRAHHDGSSGRAFTVEQKTAVIRVRRCANTAYYDILGLEDTKKECSEAEIKKAYRKLSLLTHPDKNGYDGADEAFKSKDS
jgi:hypothetical protein